MAARLLTCPAGTCHRDSPTATSGPVFIGHERDMASGGPHHGTRIAGLQGTVAGGLGNRARRLSACCRSQGCSSMSSSRSTSSSHSRLLGSPQSPWDSAPDATCSARRGRQMGHEGHHQWRIQSVASAGGMDGLQNDREAKSEAGDAELKSSKKGTEMQEDPEFTADDLSGIELASGGGAQGATGLVAGDPMRRRSYYPRGFEFMEQNKPPLLTWQNGILLGAAVIVLGVNLPWLATEALRTTLAVFAAVVAITTSLVVIPLVVTSFLGLHLVSRLPEPVLDRVLVVPAVLMSVFSMVPAYASALMDLMPLMPVVASLAMASAITLIHESQAKQQQQHLPLWLAAVAAAANVAGLLTAGQFVATLAAVAGAACVAESGVIGKHLDRVKDRGNAETTSKDSTVHSSSSNSSSSSKRNGGESRGSRGSSTQGLGLQSGSLPAKRNGQEEAEEDERGKAAQAGEDVAILPRALYALTAPAIALVLGAEPPVLRFSTFAVYVSLAAAFHASDMQALLSSVWQEGGLRGAWDAVASRLRWRRVFGAGVFSPYSVLKLAWVFVALVVFRRAAFALYLRVNGV